jgi:AAA family ATP:ADP antiporter
MNARQLMTRALHVRDEDLAPTTGGFVLFFLLFAGYFMLRPVRETMGIAGGVDQLQWLFTGTFAAMLLAMPLFGWLATRVSRRAILPWAYAFFALNLVLFAIAFAWVASDIWFARAFYIWLSVFNFIVVSLAWSLCADLLAVAQAKRVFGLLAAGASLGGLTGPLLSLLLVEHVGHVGLILIAALFLIAAIVAARVLLRWRERNPVAGDEAKARAQPLGGGLLDGALLVLRSRYLLGIAAFVLLLASVTTFLYFEQARLVAQAYPQRTDQTKVFSIIDIVVQSLAILTQLFFTGRVAQRLGVIVLLTAVPLVMAGGFLWLAFTPTFAVLAIVMVVRRAGEYAFVRPGREMLFTVVAPEAKYKAKNFLDTVVYRGGDALSAWLKALIDMLSQFPAIAAIGGAAIALLWAYIGRALARAAERRTDS